MSGIRSDMSELGQICPVTRNFMQQKSRSEAKMMRLVPDKLTISKLDNIELREIIGTTRSKLNSSIQIQG
jgi:signal transduction histidine kinase